MGEGRFLTNHHYSPFGILLFPSRISFEQLCFQQQNRFWDQVEQHWHNFLSTPYIDEQTRSTARRVELVILSFVFWRLLLVLNKQAMEINIQVKARRLFAHNILLHLHTLWTTVSSATPLDLNFSRILFTNGSFGSWASYNGLCSSETSCKPS